MIVVFTCFEDGEPFQLLARDRPVAMLPLLNYPIIHHHIETFIELGCSRFIVMVVDHPLVLKDFLGDGSRWGSSIDFVVLKEPCTSAQALDRIERKVDSDLVIVVPSEIVLDIDYEVLARFHESRRVSQTRVLSTRLLDLSGKSPPASPQFRVIYRDDPVDTGVLVAGGESAASGITVDFCCQGNFIRIKDSRSLWAANMAGLGGQLSCLARGLRGNRMGDVWVGHHLNVAAQVTLEGPSLVGNHVRANHGARILSWSVLGDGVIVDKEAQVGASVVADHTYIGTDTNVENSLVVGKLIYNVGIGQWIEVSDPFLVADTDENIVAPWIETVLEKAMAVVLLLLTVPIWLPAGLIRKARGKFFFERRQYCLTEASNLSGWTIGLHRESLLGFENRASIIGRLPGLLDVIRGRIRLVGVRPLESRELCVYGEQWTHLREQAPCGLFTPVDAEGLNAALEEEKVVAENYYAATRSFMGDVRILFRSVLKLLVMSV
jgi:NDP-sugar pyrophosphorylase family protein